MKKNKMKLPEKIIVLYCSEERGINFYTAPSVPKIGCYTEIETKDLIDKIEN